LAIHNPVGQETESAEVTQPDVVAPRFGVVGRSFRHTFESVIENRDFRMLWFGMVFAMGGFQMQMLARGILVYDLTNDYFITGLVGMGFAPALLVVSLYGGVLGDRVERRLLIQLSQAANGILAGVVAILILTNTVVWGHLLVVSIAQGAMFALQMPARQAAIPSLVKKHQLPNAFALSAMAMSMMSLIAPAIAGVVYQFSGPAVVYIAVSAIMLSSVIFTTLVPKMYPPVSKTRESVLTNIAGGFRYIAGNKLVLNLLVYSMVIAVLAMPFRMLIPAFAKDVYGAAGSEVGVLLTAIGLGGLIGSISIANLRKGHRRGWILLGGAFVAGFSLLGIVGFPVLIAGFIGMIGIGLGEQARWALGQSLMMENTDDEYRARVMSVLMMTFGLMPLGMLPLGWAMGVFGAREAVTVTAILLVISAVLTVVLFPRIRKIE
jgi:MFS family permease